MGLPPSMPTPSFPLLNWRVLFGLLPAPEEVVEQQMPGTGQGHGMRVSAFRKKVNKRRRRNKIASKSRKRNRKR